MDGLTLLQRIQETDDPLSTVIVSAYGDMANIRTAMNRGAFDFITKPIDFADLETTIRKTLAHIERLREAKRRQAAAERAHALVVALFLAQPCGAAGRRSRRGRSRRSAARDYFVVYRHRRIYFDGGDTRLEIIAPLLNDYLGGMTDIVFAHGGTVVKIVGDAMHVSVRGPGRSARSRRTRGVACALELDVSAKFFAHAGAARHRARRDAPRPRFRARDRRQFRRRANIFDYTAYGDTINTVGAARSSQQAAWHTNLCRRERGEPGRGFKGTPDRRPVATGTKRTIARIRAALG